MNIAKKTVLLAVTAGLLSAGLCACDSGTPGENLDRALDNAGEKVKDAGEAIQPK